MRTAVISHPFCRKHKSEDAHPECPERLDAINDRLLASGLDIAVEQRTAPKASLDHIALVHEPQMIERVLTSIPSEGIKALDDDTWLCPDSFKAIERAAGAGILAVDEILAGKLDAAFCAVRPPGHHASHTHSAGFCVFNNLAIGVEYAKQCGIERIAVLDIDVHHGDGTQAIFHDDPNVLFCSLFQYPLYPNPEIVNHKTLINSPLAIASDGNDFKALVTQQWFPRLEEFSPQLIFISAGFDAHLEDDMASLKFVEQDYYWFSQEVAKLSQAIHCQGVISYLEGGYELSSLGRSAIHHIKGLVESELNISK